jgi:type IV pilus assembly protein PilP
MVEPRHRRSGAYPALQRHIVRGLTAALLALTAAGCGADMADLERYVADTKARPGGRIEPIPEVIPHEVFVYPGHDRDPFDATILAMRDVDDRPITVGSVTIDRDRPPEYLESFPLDTLRMVGTMQREGVQYALIRTPDRTIQRVTEGNYLGQNHGRIGNIRDSGVDITEIVPDGFGGYVERDTSIALTE